MHEPAAEAVAPVSDADRHARALAQFQASAEAFADQRTREVADLRFCDFDEQWPAEIKALRAGTPAAGGALAVPARPCLTINLLRAPIQQITNTQRNAKLALTFSPKGDGAAQGVADAYEDIVRAIQADSRAHLARNWAFDRAAKAGLGWYRIDTQYVHDDPEDDGPDADDQEIVYRRVLNQASIYPDPNAQEPDFSDGRFLFQTQDLSFAEYRRRYPDSDLASADGDELAGIGDDRAAWLFTADGADGQTVRIAEAWEVVETERRTPRGRVFISRVVWWAKLNGIEYLEKPREWNGQYIPLIPAIGEESNVNGERRWIGIVRPGRDAQTSYNVMRSRQVEGVGLATMAPYVLDPEQIEGYELYWQQSNTRNFPYLPARSFTRDGRPFLPITRNVAEPAIQAVTLAAHEAKDDLHQTTGVPPVALGQLDPHERSGKAIAALQGQAEIGTSGFLDNLATMSMMYEGKVIRDLIPRIYDRPGRIVPAVDLKDQRRQVMVGQAFKQQGGQPVPAHPDDPAAEIINLDAGEFSVAVTIGKSYATRRKEAAAFLTDLIPALPPEMAAAIAPAMIEAQDSPDAKKIAEIAKNALPPALQKAYDDEGGDQPQLPPEVEAQMTALSQERDDLKQQVAIDTAKQQATLAKAQLDRDTAIETAHIDAQTRLEIATAEHATRIAIAHIAAATKGLSMEAHAAEEAQALGHQAQQADADRAQQAALAVQGQQARAVEAEQGQAHALEQADQGHQQALEQGQQGAQFAAEQAEQAAALAPTPEGAD